MSEEQLNGASSLFYSLLKMLASLVKSTTIQKNIVRLTLDNVKRRNALSSAMLQELQTHLNTIQHNPEIRVVILRANGPAFSSGHDLNELLTNETKQNASLMDLCSSVMQQVVHLPKPVIAQVDGIATAAGCQLVASCDLAYASKKAQFATPGVNLGLFCSTPGVALGRCVHPKHAMSMLLTGDMISAKQAQEIGLINAAIEESHNESLDDKVLNIATTIASKSPKAIEMGKSVFYKQLGMPLDAAYELASKTMIENMKHNEAKEGIDAFLTKRAPSWSNEG